MIKLRNVYMTKHAAGFLYQLLAQRDPEESISHTTMPSMPAHVQFVNSHPYRSWWIIERTIKPEWVGAVYLTNANEIGISIDQQHRRKGYARAALERVLTTYEPLLDEPSIRSGKFIAHINPANQASIKLFTGLGMVHISNTYAMREREPWTESKTHSTHS